MSNNDILKKLRVALKLKNDDIQKILLLANFNVSISELNEMSAFVKQDKEVRLLSYKILVDKFNEKYSELNEGQKNLLRQYINSVSEGTELKEFINKEVSKLQKELKTLSATIDDKVVKIKLSEVTNLLNEITSAKAVKDNHVLNMLRYHELIKELKKV